MVMEIDNPIEDEIIGLITLLDELYILQESILLRGDNLCLIKVQIIKFM